MTGSRGGVTFIFIVKFRHIGTNILFGDVRVGTIILFGDVRVGTIIGTI
jgi:hypothetical protein